MRALRDWRGLRPLPVLYFCDVELYVFDFRDLIRNRLVRPLGRGRLCLFVRWIVDEEAIVFQNIQSGERVFVDEGLAESGLTAPAGTPRAGAARTRCSCPWTPGPTRPSRRR